MTRNNAREDRIKGVLIGSAVGDALGVHYETGIRSHGNAAILGGGYGFEPGEFSDDTQQSVCVALGKSDPHKVAANLLTWYASHPKDIGIQTRAVMSRVRTSRGLVMASLAYARRQQEIKRPKWEAPLIRRGSSGCFG